MDFRPLADVLLKYSPALATSIGSPIGGLVMSLLMTIFGGDKDDLVSTIQADPNAGEKIKQLEIEHQDVLAKSQADEYRASVDDRESARQRQLEEEKITGKKDNIVPILAISICLGFFIVYSLNYIVRIEENTINAWLAAQLCSAFLMVVGFYFGSSAQRQ